MRQRRHWQPCHTTEKEVGCAFGIRALPVDWANPGGNDYTNILFHHFLPLNLLLSLGPTNGEHCGVRHTCCCCVKFVALPLRSSHCCTPAMLPGDDCHDNRDGLQELGGRGRLVASHPGGQSVTTLLPVLCPPSGEYPALQPLLLPRAGVFCSTGGSPLQSCIMPASACCAHFTTIRAWSDRESGPTGYPQVILFFSACMLYLTIHSHCM